MSTSPRRHDRDVDVLVETALTGHALQFRRDCARVIQKHGLTVAWDEMLGGVVARLSDPTIDGRAADEADGAVRALVAELRSAVERRRPRTSPPDTVMVAGIDDATPVLPLLATQAVMADHGVNAWSIGPSANGPRLSQALRRHRCRVLVLWATSHRPDDQSIADALDAHQPHPSRAGAGLLVLLAGPGWDDLARHALRRAWSQGRIESVASLAELATAVAGALGGDAR